MRGKRGIDMQSSRMLAEDRGQNRAPDPQGQAALILAESILHGLIDKGLLTNDDAIAIVSVATEAKEQIIEEQDEPIAIGRQSLRLLHRISRSLGIDGQNGNNISSAQDSR